MVKEDLFKAFSGRRILITGHTGFKGSWLSLILYELGAEVMGYALMPEDADNHFKALNLRDLVRNIEGDVRDRKKLAKTVSQFRPEFVFHLAAQPIVRRSYADPFGTFETNVMGSVSLLDAVRHCDSVRSLVFVTSDKCYENVEWIWGYRENDRLGGHDPYSASKAAAEIVFSSFLRSYFVDRPDLGAASTRAGNVIGGGDWADDRIVPDCVRAIREGRPIVIRNPRATRPWQHVLDPLSGYLQLAVQLQDNPERFSGAWNFGPSSTEARNVIEVAQHIVSSFGYGEIEIDPTDGKQHEASLLQLNCDKAHQLMKWQPRWTVNQTLDATADWYRRFLNGEEAINLTREQINQFNGEI